MVAADDAPDADDDVDGESRTDGATDTRRGDDAPCPANADDPIRFPREPRTASPRDADGGPLPWPSALEAPGQGDDGDVDDDAAPRGDA